MKHVERCLCQCQLQHQLFTQLSDLMMRRRSSTQLSIGRLANHLCSVAYPWRLYDMLVDLAEENMQVLVSAGDNLHQTLEAARQVTLADAQRQAKQLHAVRRVPHIQLRAPTWLHVRVLLAAMIVLESNHKQIDSSIAISDETDLLQVTGHLTTCRIEIGFALSQLAEGCDQFRDGQQVPAELFQSIGDRYMQQGRNYGK